MAGVSLKNTQTAGSMRTVKTMRIDEEIISPEEYLNLTTEQKQEIEFAAPYVKPFDANDLDDVNFAGIRIRHTNPRYSIKF
ncbi:MAG: hypothetical protein OEV66_01500 [Spirochaetia bacterium]|nr:hypothetical protein [Spirochaetia bacterium]